MSWSDIWGNSEASSHFVKREDPLGLGVAENVTEIYSVAATKVGKDYEVGEIAIRALSLHFS